MNPRGRYGRTLPLLAALVLACAGALWLARAPAERAVAARLAGAAQRRGLQFTAESVRLGLHPLVVIRRARLSKPGTWTLEADEAAFDAARRLVVGRARWSGPASLTVEAVPTEWHVAAPGRIELRRPASGLRAAWREDAGRRELELRADRARLGGVVTIARAGAPLLDAGVLGGVASFVRSPERTAFEVDVQAEEVRFASLDAADDAVPSYGQPTAVHARLSGTWRAAERRLELRSWRVKTGGASASGTLSVTDVGPDAQVELTLDVERVDFARLLEISALEPPAVAAQAVLDDRGLGSAALHATVSGRVGVPASFRVSQRLDFAPPRRVLPALERLRGAFVHEVATTAGGVRAIDVSPGSPDFIAIEDVPPLMVETLLLGEDYGFFGHRGVDLSELPAALLTNWARGGAARGASTITQQLAKNLFLSRDKRLGRKLQELSLALLLEATLDKRRILEIYVNVIEWGPDLFGLRPASRRYFGCEPAELTPKQMAFLVALVPGPRKYQRSFASGALSPGFRPLVDNLLAKLRSVGALTEDEHRSALAEELYVLPAGAGVSAR
ncbi:MAG TPA: transglycosylase domain-containing protein [Vicinamibacteria bacterium]